MSTDEKTFLVFLLEDGENEQRPADRTNVNVFAYSNYMHSQNEHTTTF